LLLAIEVEVRDGRGEPFNQGFRSVRVGIQEPIREAGVD
jgi:hypothetical protein